MKIIIISIIIILALTPVSSGIQALDGILEDALVLNASSARLADYLEAERGVAGNSFKHSSTLSGGDFHINNSDLRYYTILPLGEKKGALAISAANNVSRFGLSQGQTSVDLNSGSNSVGLFYASRLNDYLDIGIGVNQSNAAADYNRNPGFSCGVRISPLKAVEVEYSHETIRSGNIASVGYGGEIFTSQSGGVQDNNLGDRTEMAVTFKAGSKIKFRGLIGKNDREQSVMIDPGDDRYSYIRLGRGVVYGSAGIEYNYNKFDVNLDLISSATNLSSAGGLFGVASADLVLDEDSIDKTADLASNIKATGCRIGVANSANDRLRIKTDLSYFKVLFDGDARTWNSWFFGMVQKLDTEYVAPIDSADVLVGSFGAKYAINDSFDINYSIKQLVPIAVGRKELAGNDDSVNVEGASGSAISGGSIQTFGVACYF